MDGRSPLTERGRPCGYPDSPKISPEGATAHGRRGLFAYGEQTLTSVNRSPATLSIDQARLVSGNNMNVARHPAICQAGLRSPDLSSSPKALMHSRFLSPSESLPRSDMCYLGGLKVDLWRTEVYPMSSREANGDQYQCGLLPYYGPMCRLMPRSTPGDNSRLDRECRRSERCVSFEREIRLHSGMQKV